MISSIIALCPRQVPWIWSRVKVLNVFSVSIVKTPLKLGIKDMHKIDDVTECCNSLRQVPVSMFHIRTVDPEALKAIGVDIVKAVIGPECPEKVNKDVQL